jgi:hypothetical protein
MIAIAPLEMDAARSAARKGPSNGAAHRSRDQRELDGYLAEFSEVLGITYEGEFGYFLRPLSRLFEPHELLAWFENDCQVDELSRQHRSGVFPPLTSFVYPA